MVGPNVSRRQVKDWEACNVSDRLEVIEKASPIEDVECDERERKQKSGEGVDLADAVHVTSRSSARHRLHAVVAATSCGWALKTLGQRGPDVPAALPAPSQLRRVRRRRGQTTVVLAPAPDGCRQRRLRLAVNVLRRRQRTLD